MSDSTFVAVVTALTLINEDDSRDSTRRAAARDSVLQGSGLTARDLERAARALSDDPDRSVAAWQQILKDGGPERPR